MIYRVVDSNKNNQVNRTTSSDQVPYGRACLRKTRTLIKYPMVSKKAKISEETEKNEEATRVKWD